jgi:solute carrier family 66 (lysosomal lysine-arginine transporter), member 1
LKLLLALYFVSVDIVLLCQYLSYEGFTLIDRVDKATPAERSVLLPRQIYPAEVGESIVDDVGSTNRVISPSQEHYASVIATHLSLARALPEPSSDQIFVPVRRQYSVKFILFRVGIVLFIFSAGVAGWWFGDNSASVPRSGEERKSRSRDQLEYDILGQVFGYICTMQSLGARIPQIILNYRRKSTEGVSMLLYMISIIANIAFALSIFLYAPTCWRPSNCQPGEVRSLYWKYIRINAPWLLLSMGSLLLDSGVLIQYFEYR